MAPQPSPLRSGAGVAAPRPDGGTTCAESMPARTVARRSSRWKDLRSPELHHLAGS